MLVLEAFNSQNITHARLTRLCLLTILVVLASNPAMPFTCPFGNSKRNLPGQFFPKGKGAMRLTLYEAPTRETRRDLNTGNYVPYSFR